MTAGRMTRSEPTLAHGNRALTRAEFDDQLLADVVLDAAGRRRRGRAGGSPGPRAARRRCVSRKSGHAAAVLRSAALQLAPAVQAALRRGS